MLVYDVTNETSFTKLEEWREAFVTQAGLTDHANYPFMIIGNKIDDEKGRTVRSCPSARPPLPRLTVPSRW